jgi:hypothetical protein
MSNEWTHTLLSVFVVSAISLIGIAAISFSDRTVRRTIFISVSLAAGAMFGDAFIHILPESFAEQAESFGYPPMFCSVFSSSLFLRNFSAGGTRMSLKTTACGP